MPLITGPRGVLCGPFTLRLPWAQGVCCVSERRVPIACCGRRGRRRTIAEVGDRARPDQNNAAERALRGPVIGRKNHYGSRSLRGTQFAALLYTLCESARLIGVDAHAYRSHALDAALTTPGTVTLPDALLPTD